MLPLCVPEGVFDYWRSAKLDRLWVVTIFDLASERPWSVSLRQTTVHMLLSFPRAVP